MIRDSVDGSTSEATIVIEGHTLTFAQSMTIRVALESFCTELHTSGLGNDEHGKTMTKAYLNRIDEIREFLYRRGTAR